MKNNAKDQGKYSDAQQYVYLTEDQDCANWQVDPELPW